MKKKTKRYADGGLAGIADSANALMGEVKGFADKISYGDSTNTGLTKQPGFLSLQPQQAQQTSFSSGATPVTRMKKGGQIKHKSASARADGIALRGKTRAC